MSVLRVCSFNIRGSYVTRDGDNIWEKRATLNVETIRAIAPDLIGFQELQLGNLAVYERELPEFDFVLGPKYNHHPPHCYPSVFWKRDKLSKLSAHEFWLSETPECHSESWDTACIRSAQWLHLREKSSGAEFLHLNTHLDHVSERARVEGAKLIARKLEELPGTNSGNMPLLITGDFNTRPGSPAWQAFEAARFRDALREAGGQGSPPHQNEGAREWTFHGFTGEPSAKHGRIDWILLRDGAQKWRVTSYEKITRSAPPQFPSDHFPIVAEVELHKT